MGTWSRCGWKVDYRPEPGECQGGGRGNIAGLAVSDLTLELYVSESEIKRDVTLVTHEPAKDEGKTSARFSVSYWHTRIDVSSYAIFLSYRT